MIQFLNVSKVYKTNSESIVALEDVSFEISEGEFVFLVGPSGSGKTSILRQIIREEMPSAGKIYFKDSDVTSLNRRGIYMLRRQIGIIFQDYKLIENKNAYENVAFAMEAAGQSKKEITETVPYVLDIVNLADRKNAFPRELSGGEKQRVAIARAIANNPALLIADEPTGNLDPESAWDIVQILSKVNGWGTTVIMSTHGTEIVNSLQKRVLRLENGKLVRDDKKGSYEELDEYSLKVIAQMEGEDDSTPENLLTEKKKPKLTKLKKKEAKKDQENTDSLESEDEENVEIDDLENVKDDNTEDVEDGVDAIDNDKVTDTEVSKKGENKKLKKLKSKIIEADNSSLTTLKLSDKLIKKLEESGYNDIEDILTAGVAKVTEKLTKMETKQLARAIKKFLTSE